MATGKHALVWTVLALEVVRGIVDDLYLLARGDEVAPYVIWIAVHTAIIITGLWGLRSAQLFRAGRTRRATVEVDA